MYPFLLVTHLLAAIAFIGTLFFEVVIWHRARQQLADTAQSTADQAIAVRSRKVLHGVVLLLYGAGVGLAWQYRGALSQPLASSFGMLLSLKILPCCCTASTRVSMPRLVKRVDGVPASSSTCS